jgi:hypothetical protein
MKMAAMSTSMSEFSDSENRRTWAVTGHTTTKPKLVIQKRKTATSTSGVNEDDIQVVFGTVDGAGLPLQSKAVFTANFRRPVNGASADNTAALAVIRDIVASDEFAAVVTGQVYLKP